MTGHEHYEEAERLLASAMYEDWKGRAVPADNSDAFAAIAASHAHATLALAAYEKQKIDSATARRRYNSVGVQ